MGMMGFLATAGSMCNTFSGETFARSGALLRRQRRWLRLRLQQLQSLMVYGYERFLLCVL